MTFLVQAVNPLIAVWRSSWSSPYLEASVGLFKAGYMEKLDFGKTPKKRGFETRTLVLPQRGVDSRALAETSGHLSLVFPCRLDLSFWNFQSIYHVPK